MTNLGELNRLRVNGFDMAYVEEGAGKPVVFVHGTITDHRTWNPHRQAVAKHYHVFCPDLRYCGTGAWPDDGRSFSVQSHADDLAAFIRSLVAEPVTLVGWSLGGAISMVTAVQNPGLVDAMLLYEPSLATFLTDPEEAKAAADDRAMACQDGMALVETGDLKMAARVLIDGLNGPGMFDRVPSSARSMVLDNARTLPLMAAMPPPPSITADELRALGIPLKVVVGGETRAFFKMVGQRAAELSPLGAFQSIDGAVHLWPALEPDAFSRLVLDFLSGS